MKFSGARAQWPRALPRELRGSSNSWLRLGLFSSAPHNVGISTRTIADVSMAASGDGANGDEDSSSRLWGSDSVPAVTASPLYQASRCILTVVLCGAHVINHVPGTRTRDRPL